MTILLALSMFAGATLEAQPVYESDTAGVARDGAQLAAAPRLVVQITVDQLRGDMPSRFRERFGPGGFSYLLEHGVVYTQAHYQHSATFTAVGHATIAIGGHTAQHGIVGNDWYDRDTGRDVYCVEDDRHHPIGEEATAHEGSSPRNLTSSTVGDELIVATAGVSRVFSVSGKDRGAILPGGHLGKAFWYDSASGRFISSTYYYPSYPDWVSTWNTELLASRYKNGAWELLRPVSEYIYAKEDDRPYERSYKALGRVFPHALGNDDASGFYATLRFTPVLDELTFAFVEELLHQEGLGQRDATDMLCVSFSATDYIGHAFGPNSLEAEDNLLRLDATLAKFFALLDEVIGLDRTLIVLTSDHGTDASPEHHEHLGRASGRHYPERFLASLNTALQVRFGTDRPLVKAFWNPSLYLDHEAVTALGLDLETVERALAEEICRLPGFASAVTRTELMRGTMSADPIHAKVQRSFHPRRSGSVLVVQAPFWYLYPEAEAYASMHGSPYSYDTYVPIMVTGHKVTPKVVDRSVSPADIAPTLSAYLGILPPSGATGAVLAEVLAGIRP